MAPRLPKIQPPSDPVHRQKIADASELARNGDMKAANTALKEAIAMGAIVPAAQRQVVMWWSAGQYDIPGFEAERPPPADGGYAAAAIEKAPEAAVAKKEPKPLGEYEVAVINQMRKNCWSRKRAEEFIEQGGLEQEQAQTQMYNPMDDAFDKLKSAGPPQWFIDAFSKNEDGTDSLPAEASQERKDLEARLAGMQQSMMNMGAAAQMGMGPQMGLDGPPPQMGLEGMGGMGDMQQMMQNPQMMQKAQELMQNPQALAQMQQQIQNDPQMSAQMQQMMNDPQARAQMQQMMGGGGT